MSVQTVRGQGSLWHGRFMAWRAAVLTVLVLLTLLIPVPVLGAGAESVVDARPNIILISADDMRLDDMWVMDNVRALIGDEGTTFSNFYTPFPLCCPARASIMTGQHAHNHGVLDNKAPLGGYAALDGTSTLATWLHDAGYLTTFAGKYLNRYGEKPVSVPPGWDDWHATVGGGDYFDTRVFENGVPTQYTGPYQTDLYADISSDIITRSAASDAPFFLWSSFYAPHSGTPVESDDPINTMDYNMNTAAVAPRHRDAFAGTPLPQDPSFNEADVSDKPADIANRILLTERTQAAMTEAYQQRLEALLALDEAVGLMMATLGATGELANTIVAFTSDNGFMLGEHRVPAGKTLPYEPSAHVPFLIRGPGFPAGVSRDQLSANIDVAPTFVDAANAQAGLVMDGTSLLPLAADPSVGMGRNLLMEAGPEAVGEPMSYTGVRTDQWLYVEYSTGELELYDMVQDPYQLQSRHADPAYSEARTELAAVLAALRDCSGPTCRGEPAPTVPPTVTASTPADNATNVAIRVSPTATFSEPVTGVSGTTFTLKNSAGAVVPAMVSYDATTQAATLNPSADLAQDTQYTATLVGGASAIRDAEGNPLVTITWTYLTGPRPTVTNRNPASDATRVAVAANVTAKFREPVNGVSDTTFTLESAAGSLVPAVVTYNANTRVATLNPIDNLAQDTRYTATLTGGPSAIRDVAGNPLVTTEWTYLTGPKPTLRTRTPAADATGVSRTANISATFREPVIGVSEATFTLKDAVTGTTVLASVSRNGTTNQFILDPDDTLMADTRYTVSLTGGTAAISDVAGNPLTSTSWSFTTGS